MPKTEKLCSRIDDKYGWMTPFSIWNSATVVGCIVEILRALMADKILIANIITSYDRRSANE